MKNTTLLILLFFACSFGLMTQPYVSGMTDPLAVVKLIGDKLIRDTPFKFRMTFQTNNPKFDGLQFVDFGRTFGTSLPAVAYAYTQLTANADIEMVLQAAHNDGCKIWVNGELAYEKNGKNKMELRFEERSVEMTDEFKVKLKKGDNSVLIKSGTYGKEWVVYLQPPSLKGAVVEHKVSYPEIGLKSVPNVDQKIAQLTNWLVLGSFANPDGKGMETIYAPEKEIIFGKMYEGATSPITWTIPKAEVLGDLINALPWGTNYTWNYHNGGVAWAMQQVTGEAKYNQYATNFCDFQLNSAPFIEYQVKTLRAVNSANNGFLFSPLLDFTLALALPFIYKLRKDNSFANREAYVTYIERMLKYAKDEQVRFPGSNIYTRLTPEKYTTWVDDMFM